MAPSWQRRNLLLPTSKEIYHRLESTAPGFLKTDVYKYAKANNPPVEPLKSFTDVEILRLDICQLFVLPKSKTNLRTEKRLTGKSRREVQLVPNFSSCEIPIVAKAKLTLCSISNPYGPIQFSPVLSLGEGPWVECLQTWWNQGGNLGNVGGLMNNKRRKSQTTQHIKRSPN